MVSTFLNIPYANKVYFNRFWFLGGCPHCFQASDGECRVEKKVAHFMAVTSKRRRRPPEGYNSNPRRPLMIPNLWQFLPLPDSANLEPSLEHRGPWHAFQTQMQH